MPHLLKKVRPTQSDGSRHLLCPHCGIRTKLNTLGDGRRKCTTCGKKFRIHKVTEGNKLQQCAEILLCFCLDFSERRTAQITYHRYRLVVSYYEHFRRLLAEKSLSPEKIRLLSTHAGNIHVAKDTSRCRWCKTNMRARVVEKPPVFGVQLKSDGEVLIEPLSDDEAMMYFHSSDTVKLSQNRNQSYTGFICCRKFHRLAKTEKAGDGSEMLWTWIRERVRTHSGIWKRNTGFTLKELEWKYNNRSLDPDLQAQKIIASMPEDFLTTWMGKQASLET